MTVDEGLIIAKTFLEKENFPKATATFRRRYDDGLLYDLDIPELLEGDFGGPFCLFVFNDGKTKLVNALASVLKEPPIFTD